MRLERFSDRLLLGALVAAVLLVSMAVVQRQRLLSLVGREADCCHTWLYAGTDAEGLQVFHQVEGPCGSLPTDTAQLPSPGPGVPVSRIVPTTATPAASPP